MRSMVEGAHVSAALNPGPSTTGSAVRPPPRSGEERGSVLRPNFPLKHVGPFPYVALQQKTGRHYSMADTKTKIETGAPKADEAKKAERSRSESDSCQKKRPAKLPPPLRLLPPRTGRLRAGAASEAKKAAAAARKAAPKPAPTRVAKARQGGSGGPGRPDGRLS